MYLLIENSTILDRKKNDKERDRQREKKRKPSRRGSWDH